MPTPEEVMFGEALLAARSGQRARSRDLLTRLIKTRPDNPEYWVWMSAVVDTPKERVYCLKEALRLDPQNAAAQRGLTLIGALPPKPETTFPPAAQKRNWQSQVSLSDGSDSARVKSLPPRQLVMMGAAVLVLVVLVSIAFVSAQSRQRAARPAYYLPTGTSAAEESATSVPTFQVSGTSGPLALLFQQTFTPTPLYVNTPHSVSEAFRIGQRAYQRGEWENARIYFEQVVPMEPQSADILYYIGETYRQEGALEDALEAYGAALEKNAGFAPAYLGRARALLAQDADQMDNAQDDLKEAIARDPNYGEAFLELAALQIQAGDATAALRTLDIAEDRMPESALIYLYRAQAYLASGKSDLALENAYAANQLDPALLLAYRMIGETLQSKGSMPESLEPLSTYLYYTPDDAAAWAWLANAQLSAGDKTAALRSLEKSLKLDSRQMDARLVRAQLLLDEGRAEQALDDFEAILRSDRDSFAANMGAAQSLIVLRYPGDAYQQIESAKRLVLSDAQKAEWQYWRARSLDALGEVEVALRDYRALVALPKGVADADWIAYAQRRIAVLDKNTPTPAPVKTKTPRPSATPSR